MAAGETVQLDSPKGEQTCKAYLFGKQNLQKGHYEVSNPEPGAPGSINSVRERTSYFIFHEF